MNHLPKPETIRRYTLSVKPPMTEAELAEIEAWKRIGCPTQEQKRTAKAEYMRMWRARRDAGRVRKSRIDVPMEDRP